VQTSAVAFLLVLAGFTGLASLLADRHRGRWPGSVRREL